MTARTIIKTETAGWFEDPATGKKTRKQDGDNIVTRAEYEQTLLDADPAQKAADNGGQATEAKPAPAPATDAEQVELTSGKSTTGKVLKIKCAWVEPDKRTEAQEKLFASNFKGVKSADTYDRVKAAAGGKRSAMPDGRVRVIKPQDAFQARFHPENQQKWRAELRRRKNKARAETARRAAAK